MRSLADLRLWLFPGLLFGLTLGLTLGLSAAVPAGAAAPCGGDFGTWLSGVEQDAAAAGISQRAIQSSLAGMTYDPADDFDHPGLPAGHPLARHVLYRVRGVSPPPR